MCFFNSYRDLYVYFIVFKIPPPSRLVSSGFRGVSRQSSVISKIRNSSSVNSSIHLMHNRQFTEEKECLPNRGKYERDDKLEYTKPFNPMDHVQLYGYSEEMGNTIELDEIITSPTDERKYAAFILPNGLRCIVAHVPHATKSGAAMNVFVGHQSDGELSGCAHFTEHMQFLGTEKYPDESEYSAFLQKNGGGSNASTSAQGTNYYFTVGSNEFEGALDRFSQFFLHPRFDADSTLREVNAVDSEFLKNINSDGRRGYHFGKATCNPGHPESQFGSGHKASLLYNVDNLSDAEAASKARDTMMSFFRTQYSANTMCLAVMGGESLDVLKDLCMRLFSGIQNNDRLPEYARVHGVDVWEAMSKEVMNKQLEETGLTLTSYPPDLWGPLKNRRYLADSYIHTGKAQAEEQKYEQAYILPKTIPDVTHSHTDIPGVTSAAPRNTAVDYPGAYNRQHVIYPMGNQTEQAFNWRQPAFRVFGTDNPLTLMSSYLGHEGKGSLKQFLHAKGWVSELMASYSGSSPSSSEVSLGLILTSAGIANLPQVIQAVHEYLLVLCNSSVEEYKVVEMDTKVIGANSFRFAESRPVQNSVNYLASALQKMTHIPLKDASKHAEAVLLNSHKPALLFRQGDILTETPPYAVYGILSHMLPSHCRMDLSTKEPFTALNRKECHYGVQFGVMKIDDGTNTFPTHPAHQQRNDIPKEMVLVDEEGDALLSLPFLSQIEADMKELLRPRGFFLDTSKDLIPARFKSTCVNVHNDTFTPNANLGALLSIQNCYLLRKNPYITSKFEVCVKPQPIGTPVDARGVPKVWSFELLGLLPVSIAKTLSSLEAPVLEDSAYLVPATAEEQEVMSRKVDNISPYELEALVLRERVPLRYRLNTDAPVCVKSTSYGQAWVVPQNTHVTSNAVHMLKIDLPVHLFSGVFPSAQSQVLEEYIGALMMLEQYDAQHADISIQVEVIDCGLQVAVSGFVEPATVCLHKVLACLRNLSDSVYTVYDDTTVLDSDNRFHGLNLSLFNSVARKELESVLETNKEAPTRLSRRLSNGLLNGVETNRILTSVELARICSITEQALANKDSATRISLLQPIQVYIHQLFQSCRLTYVVGGCTPEFATVQFDAIQQGLTLTQDLTLPSLSTLMPVAHMYPLLPITDIKPEDLINQVKLYNRASLPLSPAEVKHNTCLRLHRGEHALVRVHSTNANDQNSAARAMYFLGDSLEDNIPHYMRVALASVTAKVFHTRVFAQLRTKEALGYLVHTSVYAIRSQMFLDVSVQGQKDSEYLLHRIETALVTIREELEKLTDDDFIQVANAEMNKLTEQSLSYSSMVSIMASQLFDGSGEFTQFLKFVAAYKNINKKNVLAFIDRYVMGSVDTEEMQDIVLSKDLAQVATYYEEQLPVIEVTQGLSVNEVLANALCSQNVCKPIVDTKPIQSAPYNATVVTPKSRSCVYILVNNDIVPFHSAPLAYVQGDNANERPSVVLNINQVSEVSNFVTFKREHGRTAASFPGATSRANLFQRRVLQTKK